MKKTKIIATLGPACDDKNILREMVNNGLNVFRINMSHATKEEVDFRVKCAKELSEELDNYIGILFDTKGPEIRSGIFEKGSIYLKKGNLVSITNKDIVGNENLISINYPTLINDLNIGNIVLLNNGLMKLTVVEKKEDELVCKVEVDGEIKNKRMVNLPDIVYSMPYLSEADRMDIITSIKNDADFIALSFVSCKEDVLAVKEILKEYNNNHIQLICKIENQRGIDNIDEILEVSDGIMVARGDLGVEIPIEKLPIVQKMLINKCRMTGKICITATEMLASMEKSLRPTRAEVSDVANAVFDGTDAIMLSGETSVGEFPIETIKVMNDIAKYAEDQMYLSNINRKCTPSDITKIITYNAYEMADVLKSKVIIVTTMSGYTARSLSNYHPNSVIVATTPNLEVARSLVLNYGIYPKVTKLVKSIDEIINDSIEITKKIMQLNSKDKIVIVGGLPLGETNNTNFMKVEEI